MRVALPHSGQTSCTLEACSGASTRVGHKVLSDGRKVRVCRKCEGVVDK